MQLFNILIETLNNAIVEEVMWRDPEIIEAVRELLVSFKTSHQITHYNVDAIRNMYWPTLTSNNKIYDVLSRVALNVTTQLQLEGVYEDIITTLSKSLVQATNDVSGYDPQFHSKLMGVKEGVAQVINNKLLLTVTLLAMYYNTTPLRIND